MKPTAIYRPLPWQVQPWLDKSPILLLTGSAGGGKSRLAAEKLHAYCLKYPGATALMMRKTRESMTNSTVLFLERKVIGGASGVRHYPSKDRFEYPNGSILSYGGMKDEEQRERIRSIGQDGAIDIAWLEEATRFTDDDFNEVLPRMRGKAGPWKQVILSTNPDGPMHWINQRLILGGHAKVYYSSALENPNNPPEYAEWLNMLTGILALRLREGKWVQAEGVVFSEFDEGNLTDAEPDPEKPIELAIDEGYIDPRAILFIQRTPDRILVFDEIYHSQHLPEVCVQEVVDRCAAKGWPLPEIAIIPTEAVTLRERLRKANIPARPGTHKIVDGIQRLRGYILDGNGHRTLQIHRRCVNLINELTSGYQYPATGSRKDTETPLDKDNHAIDALRYWVWMRARR